MGCIEFTIFALELEKSACDWLHYAQIISKYGLFLYGKLYCVNLSCTVYQKPKLAVQSRRRNHMKNKVIVALIHAAK